jgi:broad specificity phosphatase PhoE
VSEEEVRSGDVPPPELLGREHAERREGRPVTRKQWRDDWYSRRYERDDHADGDAAGHGEESSSVGDELRRAVEEYRSRNPSASVAEIAGGVAAAGSPGEVREIVAEMGEE